MSRLFKVEQFMRYTLDGDDQPPIEAPWSTDIPFHKAFEAAHQNADGSSPTIEQCGGDSFLWSFAIRIRRVEEQLIERQKDIDTKKLADETKLQELP